MSNIEIWVEWQNAKQAEEVIQWAKSCQSYVGHSCVDMSDFNSWHGPDDIIAVRFSDEKDATLFRLRWSQ